MLDVMILFSSGLWLEVRGVFSYILSVVAGVSITVGIIQVNCVLCCVLLFLNAFFVDHWRNSVTFLFWYKSVNMQLYNFFTQCSNCGPSIMLINYGRKVYSKEPTTSHWTHFGNFCISV